VKELGHFLLLGGRSQVEVAILLSKLDYQESGICSGM